MIRLTDIVLAVLVMGLLVSVQSFLPWQAGLQVVPILSIRFVISFAAMPWFLWLVDTLHLRGHVPQMIALWIGLTINSLIVLIIWRSIMANRSQRGAADSHHSSSRGAA